MNVLTTFFIFISLLIFGLRSSLASEQFTSSQVIRYALTAHGINYLLRDRRGSTNAWTPNLKQSSNAQYNGSYVQRTVKGDTDCSGLFSAAIRYKGYRHPSKRKPSLFTGSIHESARKRKNGLRFVGKRGEFREVVQHGDAFNKVRSAGKGYGHVFFFNGINTTGSVETVEAKCTKCGVGAFRRSWNQILKAGYRIVRSDNVVDDVKNKFRVFTPKEGSAKKNSQYIIPTPHQRPYQGESEESDSYRIRRGDNLISIAESHGISLEEILEWNPQIKKPQLIRVGAYIRIRPS